MLNALDTLEQAVLLSIKTKQFDQGLDAIHDFVNQAIQYFVTAGILFSSQKLDHLCQQLGQAICREKKIAPVGHWKPEKTLFVATALHGSGGHSRVIEDLICLQPTKQHTILITEPHLCQNLDVVKKRLENLSVTFVPAPKLSSSEKVAWLLNEINKTTPGRIFIFNNNQDSIAIAALQPDFHPEQIFVHHADYLLCLGVHVPYALHIDLHSMGFHHCKNTLGIKNNAYWPLVAQDLAARPKNLPFLATGTLTTCSSGSSMKFDFPYAYRYDEVIPNLLHATKGTHIHIGPLTKNTLKKLHQGLDKYKISHNRLIHIPWVSSIWQALIDHHVDLYITSFPFGGGRSSIEAMGSGTPIAVHQHYRSPFLGGDFLIYPEGFRWKKPHELIDIARPLTPKELAHQSICARNHYERYHRPEVLQALVNGSLQQAASLEAPPVMSFTPDQMQIAIDILEQLRDCHAIQKLKILKVWAVIGWLKKAKHYFSFKLGNSISWK